MVDRRSAPLVLAPGFKICEGKVDAGPNAATADFVLEPQPWKETLVRLEELPGKPVAGAEIICAIHEVIWNKSRTDNEGRCRVTMPHDLGFRLSALPKGAPGRPLSRGDRQRAALDHLALLATDPRGTCSTPPVSRHRMLPSADGSRFRTTADAKSCLLKKARRS